MVYWITDTKKKPKWGKNLVVKATREKIVGKVVSRQDLSKVITRGFKKYWYKK